MMRLWITLNQLPLDRLVSLLGHAGYTAKSAFAIKKAYWSVWEGLEDYSFLSFTTVSEDKLYIGFKFDMRILELQIVMSTLDYLANKSEFDSDFMNHDIANFRNVDGDIFSLRF